MLRMAERDGRRVQREKQDWTQALASLIFAAVASARGQDQKAVDCLERSVVEFDRVDMVLYAAAARRRLGQQLGGNRGRDLIKTTDDWMTGQNILNPIRMTAALAPGFARRDHG